MESVLCYHQTSMINCREVEKQFQHLDEDRLNILLEIHNLVAAVSPEATVEMRRYGIIYYDASRGGPVSAGICQALVKPDHVRLAFIHGAFLPDPAGLLEGTTFPKRFMRITGYDTAPWEAIQVLILAHSVLDPRSLPVNHQPDRPS